MPSELKPCPFCGGTNIRFDEHRGEGRRMHSGETVWSMCCYDCGVAFPNRYRRELLEDAWNARVDADRIEALQAEVARLREACGILEDALQEAGDDYPGSSMQEWCQQQVKTARQALKGTDNAE